MAHRNQEREQAATQAAQHLRNRLELDSDVPTALVLGTGWGDALQLTNQRKRAFTEIPGFEKLGKLEGHAREVITGELDGNPVIALRGRVHLNEAPADPDIHLMVRLQVEMLFHLGVKNLITTCAAGALSGEHRIPPFGVGDITPIYSFLTLFAPDMPLYAGEFCNPEDALDEKLVRIALGELHEVGIDLRLGQPSPSTYAMVRGPFFEGRRTDKKAVAKLGANLIGMSTLPEACIAALYDIPMLALAFVTNDDQEVHSHEANLARAKESSGKLGQLLTNIVKRLPALLPSLAPPGEVFVYSTFPQIDATKEKN